MADSVMRRLDTWVGVPVENDRQPDSQATAMSEDDEFEVRPKFLDGAVLFAQS